MPECYDSDGGVNWYLQGTATAGGRSFSDRCGNGTGYLYEMHCSGDQIAEGAIKCANGCANGACISAPDGNGYIKVIAPNGGGNYQQGNSYDITWDSKGISNVDIEIIKGNNSEILASSIPAVPSLFIWNVGQVPGDGYKIIIKSAAEPGIYDFSDGSFMIMGL